MVPPISPFPRLAFVDVETTSVGPVDNRIAEIGVVIVDGARIDEWSALLDPGRRIADLPSEFGGEPAWFCADRATERPRFRDIATELASRLDGCLLVAHNARFDYAFLKTEFERAGMPFERPIVCSLMLARVLYPAHDCHDLDALCARHGVTIGERHRALPDARLLHQVWTAIGRDQPADAVRAAIDAQLAEPLLLPDVDAGMIDSLPAMRGVFELLDAGDAVLLAGRASNIRLQMRRYFRLDRHCARAAAIAARVKRIRWQPACGPLDARLQELALSRDSRGGATKRPPALSIRIDPVATPAASIVDLGSIPAGEADLFGIYATARKATNALLKVAVAHALCHRLLGVRGKIPCACALPAGGEARTSSACAQQRTRHLMRLTAALSPIRLRPWPYAGPVAIRERKVVHVFDQWEHLGSVRTTSDMLRLPQQRRNGFDVKIHALLQRVLPATRPAALRVLTPSGQNDDFAYVREPECAYVREPDAAEHSV